MVASVWGDGTPNEAFEVPPDSIINEQVGNYLILAADAHKVIDYIGAGGDTFTLPDAVDAGAGYFVVVRNSGTGSVTLAATGTDTVNGAATFVLGLDQTVQLLVKNADFGILLAKNTGATAASTAFTPAGNIEATTVQAAIVELDAEKAALAGSGSQQFSAAAPTTALQVVNKQYAETNFLGAAGLISQLHTAFTTAGSSTAFTVTPTVAQAALVAGMRLRLKFHATAGVAPTLAVSGLAAKALMIYTSAGAKVAASAASIIAGMLTDVEYDGVDFVILDQLPTTSSAPGTWTPGITINGSTVGIVTASSIGTYVKTGNLVTCYFSTALSSKGAEVGNVRISQLPFTADGICYSGNILAGSFATGASTPLTAEVSGDVAMLFRGITGGVLNYGGLTDAHITNTFSVFGSFTYVAV